MTTLFTLFTSFAKAQTAIKDLLRLGIDRAAIGLISPEQPSDQLKEREIAGASAHNTQASHAGVLSLLMGSRVVIVEGLGSLLVAGPLASKALSARVEDGQDPIVATLNELGLSDNDPSLYSEGVRRGNTLVSVQVAENEREHISQLFERGGALDIKQTAAEWQSDPSEQGDPNLGSAWKESRKIGTVGGTLVGAATGAAVGSLGGPVGALIGGVSGALSGAAIGAAGDLAGEAVLQQEQGEMPGMDTRDLHSDRQQPASSETGSGAAPLYQSDQELPDQEISDQDISDQELPKQGFHESASHGYRVEDEHIWALYESDYHNDFAQKYEARKHDWKNFAIAYRYGHVLASHPRYQQGSWEQHEPEIQKRWDETISGSWEDVRDAVRYAWERAKQAPYS